MHHFSIFEAIMLLCFGAAWPFSIYRSYTSRSNKGKSLLFLLVVFVGYMSGVLHKIVYQMDIVIILYSLNLILVGTDILLYLRNTRITKREQTL